MTSNTINKKLIDKINNIWYEKNKPNRTAVDKFIGKLVTINNERYLITGTKPCTKTLQGNSDETPRIVQSFALLIGTEWVEWFDFIRNYNRMVK
jgi:hypothetical protein